MYSSVASPMRAKSTRAQTCNFCLSDALKVFSRFWEGEGDDPFAAMDSGDAFFTASGAGAPAKKTTRSMSDLSKVIKKGLKPL